MQTQIEVQSNMFTQIQLKKQKIYLIIFIKVTKLKEENLHWRGQYYLVTRKIGVIPIKKIKEIVDECIPKKANIITNEMEYTPNTNANSYLTQQILELLQESEDK